MNQTIETLRETQEITEALTRISRTIDVASQLDDGSWKTFSFANEGAAAEFERKMQKRSVATRRMVAAL